MSKTAAAGGGTRGGSPLAPRLFGFPPAGALGADAAECGAAPCAGVGAEPSPEPRYLILGSFPSAQSLERREYYGNQRNHFWSIVAACLGKLEPKAYGGKLALLREARIALWDVYAACERPGSLDKDIAAGAPNPLSEFISRHPDIEAIGLNGGTAAAAFAAGLRGIGWPNSGHLVKELIPRLARAGDTALWRPSFDPSRELRIARLPSTSPVPTAVYRTAADKLPLWRRFFTIQM
jgi:hypoxanthine-DNA glycosylase